MTTHPTASVVICAYTERRWDDVRHAVRSVLDQTVPAQEIVVVIDHNPALAERARAELAGAIVWENGGPPGLSSARNTALRLVQGEVVAFLDDDAAAEPDWLERLLTPYRDHDVVAVGGRACPVWPASRPALLPAPQGSAGELDWVVGCSYLGQPTELAEVRNLMGCAMSFRRWVIERVGGFDAVLGRVGNVPLGCEETELCIRIRQQLAGVRILYEPRAVVRHRVSADRVSWTYLRRRCWAEGRSKAAVARLAGRTDALSTERDYLRRVLPKAVARELGRLASGRPQGLTGTLAVLVAAGWTAAGYARGAFDGHRQQPAASDPVYAAEVDLADGADQLKVPDQDFSYRQAQVLCRVGTRPVGLVRVPVADNVIELAAVRDKVREADLGRRADDSIPALPQPVPALSVVVPTARRPEAATRCVRALLETGYPELEVLVVDNCPAAPDSAALRALAGTNPRIRYLAEPRPGASTARNTGALAARGELVAFVDDDIEVARWWPHAVVGELADPTVDCVTSLVLPASLATPAQTTFEYVKGFSRGLDRHRFGPECYRQDPLYPFAPGRFGPGGCAAWRRAAFLRLGGFHRLLGPGTPTHSGEDLELFLRLARQDGVVVYTPRALARHQHRAGWPEVRSQMRGYGTGLSAMLGAYLTRRPSELVALLRRLPAAVTRLRQSSPASGSHPAAAGVRQLRRDELRGVLSGPFALLRSAGASKWR